VANAARILLACTILLATLSTAWADTQADPSWTDAETWAWSQVADGKTANFDVPCNASTVAPVADTVWNDACRTLRGAVVEQMLTRAPWRDAMQHQGLRIIGARITGGLDLANAHVAAATVIARSRIDGDVQLERARLDGLLAFDGSTVTGTIDATGLLSESDVAFSDGRQLAHIGDHIGGFQAQNTVTLRNAHLKGSLYLNGGRFAQRVDLGGSHIDEEMQTSGATFAGPLFGGSVQVGVKLSINSTHFNGNVVFANSVIGGLADASGSIFGGSLSLVDTHVAGDVYLSKLTAADGIDLSGTEIGGYVTLEGASSAKAMTAWNTRIAGNLLFDSKVRFDGGFTLAGGRIGGSLLMQKAPFAGPVILRDTTVVGDAKLTGASFAHGFDVLAMRVEGDFLMTGATVAGDFDATSLEVRRDLALDKGAHFSGAVNLFDAHLANSAHLENAAFDKGLSATDAQIMGSLALDNSSFGAAVALPGARIGGDLSLTGAHLTALDLTGTTVEGSLVVSAATVWAPAASAAVTQLLLVNAKVGGIQDGPVGTFKDCPTEAAPPVANGRPAARTVERDGFTYSQLGSLAGAEGADMRDRDVCWWRWWLSRDAGFSSQPYVQLAAVMAAHGDQDNSAAVLYFGRVRETQMAWDGGHYPRWALLTALKYVDGYGIGTYTFRALIWLAILTAAGVLLLKWSPGGGEKTWLWRTGASLTRLLPGIEINKEFTDFFNDPRRRRLHSLHVAVFSAFVVIGWVLGLFLVAAMTGLTQHS
jgi:cytoskeletal protein CcmA (bactofilin family)